MTQNFFDPKRTQDVEMSCTWYEFIFYNKKISDPHYGCKLQCLGTIGADLTATWSRCLLSSIARESYDRLACADGYDLSCRESDKHFNWFILTMGISNRGTRGDLKGTHQQEVPSLWQDSLSSCSLLGRTSASGCSLMREPTSTSRWASAKLLFEHHWHQDMFFTICYSRMLVLFPHL